VHLLELAELFEDCQQIGDALAGVIVIGEAVDHRHAGIPCQVDDVGMGKNACHDGVRVTTENTRCVGDALSVPQLNLIRG